ncbi:MAG TPA: ubiquinol-cytochrome c reductase iron-sulfur subunit [Acidimicrobiales bacterium]|nr:ubiquinol-cytochrome c reductase iron-sulfur subunit [Acidimicrobiales bacterium]
METSTILLIAIPVLVVLAGIVLFASMRRRDTGEAIGMLSRETSKRDAGKVSLASDDSGESAKVTGVEVERAAVLARTGGGEVVESGDTAAPVAWVPPDAESIGVTRRQFFNRSIVGMMLVGISGFGAAVIAFMWPQVSGGFGSAITVGKVDDIKKQIQDGNGFAYYPNGRMWITEYPASALPKAEAVYSPAELTGMEAGVVALYQKCPHLGCRVPECQTSQWFECPCHGSQYNQVGEKKGGPAPRGMDRFAMSVDGGVLTVDTGTVIQGPPIGTNTTGQEAEGPNCIGSSDH